MMRILELQNVDSKFVAKRDQIQSDSFTEFSVGADSMLLCVLNNLELKQDILTEAHSSTYFLHPGSMKMFCDLKQMYWWLGMKREISKFVAKCLICQQVKAKHQQIVMIPEWKWKRVTMDFLFGLPVSPRKKDLIWFIIDRLTKFGHFIPVRMNYSLEKLAELYVSEIVRLHEVLVFIISDRDLRFTSRFWGKLHEALGTKNIVSIISLIHILSISISSSIHHSDIVYNQSQLNFMPISYIR
ncbi:integrase [Gossypium australe]|uniref:Integrase n=1 Tax=Gossypium australe TaxID=47621 RepID=A0A5B6V034_9ROSI|nr:integrase [Gossypium australe]